MRAYALPDVGVPSWLTPPADCECGSGPVSLSHCPYLFVSAESRTPNLQYRKMRQHVRLLPVCADAPAPDPAHVEYKWGLAGEQWYLASRLLPQNAPYRAACAVSSLQ